MPEYQSGCLAVTNCIVHYLNHIPHCHNLPVHKLRTLTNCNQTARCEMTSSTPQQQFYDRVLIDITRRPSCDSRNNQIQAEA